jgi:hypothetical protein
MSEKMCLIVYIYMYNALTAVQVLFTRTPEHTHWLAHLLWDLLIVMAYKGKAIEISYSDARLLITFFRSFILWQQRTCFYFCLWYKKERTPKHFYAPSSNQIASCCDALSITNFMFLVSDVVNYIVTDNSQSQEICTVES